LPSAINTTAPRVIETSNDARTFATRVWSEARESIVGPKKDKRDSAMRCYYPNLTVIGNFQAGTSEFVEICRQVTRGHAGNSTNVAKRLDRWHTF